MRVTTGLRRTAACAVSVAALSLVGLPGTAQAVVVAGDDACFEPADAPRLVVGARRLRPRHPPRHGRGAAADRPAHRPAGSRAAPVRRRPGPRSRSTST